MSDKNSDAVLFHFNNYAPFRERLAECRSMISLEILGTPSEELKARVSKIQAPFYQFFIGK